MVMRMGSVFGVSFVGGLDGLEMGVECGVLLAMGSDDDEGCGAVGLGMTKAYIFEKHGNGLEAWVGSIHHNSGTEMGDLVRDGRVVETSLFKPRNGEFLLGRGVTSWDW